MDCSARTRNHRTQAGGTPAVLCGAALALLGFCCLQSAAAADMGPPFERGLELVRNELLLARSGCRAMQIVARPGGEDGAALSYLRRALGVETHLCCLTRGEGEENESGAEWGARLAVLRTRETEAACAVLGAKAWYLNLPDKGCSKSTEKTLKDWGHDRALARLVRVIRIVKPHIIFISNAADEAGGTPALPPGGGTEVLRPGAGSAGVPPAVRPESSDACYRATAQLVGEAFDAAADEAQFAEQTKTDGTGPWGVSKLYVCCGGNRPATLSLDAAEREPLSGLSAAEIAAWAAREHASLGLPPQTALQVNDKRDFALLKSRLRNTEETNLLAGLTPPPRRVTAAVDAALKQLQAAPWGELPTRPAAVGDGSPAQAIAAACAAATQEAPGEDALLGHLHAALAEAAGLRISVRSEARILTQREEASVTVTVANTGPLDATACKCELFAESTELTIADGPGEPSLPAKSVAHLTSRVSFTGNPFPSWPPENYIFDRMEARTPVRARITLHVAGAGLALTRSVPLELALPRAVAIAPDPVLVFDDPDHGDEVQGLARFRIHVTNYRRLEDAVGRLYAGIVAQGKAPVDRFATLTFRRAGETLGAEFRFMATVGQLNKGDLEVPTAVWTELANFGGPKARLRRVPLRLPAPLSVGLVKGCGDALSEALQALAGAGLGMTLTLLTADDLRAADLNKLHTIILDNHTAQSRPEVLDAKERLMQFMQDGGNVVCLSHHADEWNRKPPAQPQVAPKLPATQAQGESNPLAAQPPAETKAPAAQPQPAAEPAGAPCGELAPYPIELSTERVTDENSEVLILDHRHPLLLSPCRIWERDFQGWVQERGANFPKKWAPEFTPLLSCADPHEKALDGGLLVCDVGAGSFIYTCLAWHEQLRIGNPGAYRMLANMISYPRVRRGGKR